MVTITVNEYYSLKVAKEKLERLEASGVDNWDFYGDSLNPEGELTMQEFREKLAKELGIKD